jgi:hypothetical protein
LISVADTKDQISIIKKTLDRFGPSPAIGNEDGGRRKVGEEIRVRNDGVPAQLLISAAPLPRLGRAAVPGCIPAATCFPGLPPTMRTQRAARQVASARR